MGSGYDKKSISLGKVIMFVIIALILGGVITGVIFTVAKTDESTPTQNSTAPSVAYEVQNGSTIEVGKTVSPSVVFISNIVNARTFMSSQTEEMVSSTGSGVIYSKDGYIITNNHVVEGASKISVKLYDGTDYIATVIGTDARTDLAVIKIDAKNLQPATLGDSDKLVIGEQAIAIGNPGGEAFANSLTQGIISGLNRMIHTNEGQQMTLIQTDAAINPGNSGGALCNGAGQVIGINTIKISVSGFEGMGFAIPSNTVKSICDQLIADGKIIRPALQVGIAADVTKQLAYYNNLKVDYGVLIVPTAGGSAEKAGMQTYDIIIAINDKKVKDSGDLQDIIFRQKVGDTVKVTVQRGDSTMDMNVVLSELDQ